MLGFDVFPPNCVGRLMMDEYLGTFNLFNVLSGRLAAVPMQYGSFGWQPVDGGVFEMLENRSDAPIAVTGFDPVTGDLQRFAVLWDPPLAAKYPMPFWVFVRLLEERGEKIVSKMRQEIAQAQKIAQPN